MRESIVAKLEDYLYKNPSCNDRLIPKEDRPFIIAVPSGMEKKNFIKEINATCNVQLHYNSGRVNEGEREVRIAGHSWVSLYNNLLDDVKRLRKKREEKSKSDHPSTNKRREGDTRSETSEHIKKRLLPPSASADSVANVGKSKTPTVQIPTARTTESNVAQTNPPFEITVSATPDSEKLSASALVSLTNTVITKDNAPAESIPIMPATPDQSKTPVPAAAAPTMKSPAALMAKLGALRAQNSARERQLEMEKQEIEAALCINLEKQIQEEEAKLKKLDDKAAKIKLQKEAVGRGDLIEISDTEPETTTQKPPRR